jgi:hypothetical protein
LNRRSHRTDACKRHEFYCRNIADAKQSFQLPNLRVNATPQPLQRAIADWAAGRVIMRHLLIF